MFVTSDLKQPKQNQHQRRQRQQQKKSLETIRIICTGELLFDCFKKKKENIWIKSNSNN